MNKILLYFFILILFPVILFGQRYVNADYFKDNDIKVSDSAVYGNAISWKGKPVNLFMGIIYPELSADSLKKRPLIILLHGGGFIFGTKEAEYEKANMLAKRGFVVASISYRLGWKIRTFSNKTWDSSFYTAVYRAVQDAKAAIRFLVHNASRYGIDTSSIFMGGASAGAVTSMYASYYPQGNWDKDNSWIKDKLGGIDNSSNNLTDKYTLKGIIDMWGGVSDTSNITSTMARNTAILIFHGTVDTIIPYKKSEYPQVEGGYLIAQRYKHLGGCYQLNTLVGGEHAEDFSDEFIIEKICAFCKSLLYGSCKSEEFTRTALQ